MRTLSRALLAALLGAAAGSAAAPAQELVIEGVGDVPRPAGEELLGAAAEPGDRGPEELFVAAGRAYEQGDYAAAAALYERLVGSGFDNGHLYYNLGNARLRNGELGRAIAAYREARRRLPRDREITANLEFARKSTKDALQPPEPSPVLATLFFWHYELSPREIGIAALVLNLLFWCALTLRLFRRGSEPLKWLTLALLAPLLAAAGSLAAHELLPDRVAVVVPQEADARTAPDPEAVVRFQLHAGTEVRLEERADGWVRIALPDGQEGWMEAGQVVAVTG
ncbi:MAG: tetratricopeptide repeat protein [Thermoanaerobaculia bacterium]|nr:tetratricopeptide repeat protein [Thermoanaerobaculia bacterium]